MSNWNMRIRAAREAQKMTRKMVVQKMQQFLPESEKAVTTRSLMSWEAGEREPRVTVGVALAKALGFEDVAVLYLDSEPKLNQAGQQRLGEYRSMLLHTAEFTEKLPVPILTSVRPRMNWKLSVVVGVSLLVVRNLFLDVLYVRYCPVPTLRS